MPCEEKAISLYQDIYVNMVVTSNLVLNKPEFKNFFTRAESFEFFLLVFTSLSVYDIRFNQFACDFMVKNLSNNRTYAYRTSKFDLILFQDSFLKLLKSIVKGFDLQPLAVSAQSVFLRKFV